MTSAVADQAENAADQPQPRTSVPATPAQPAAGAVPAAANEPLGGVCSHCGAAMAPGQDWCVQCGAGAPGALSGPGWRSAAMVLGATAALALGAVAAAYAALSKSPPPTHMVTAVVAQTPAPTSSAPPASTTTPPGAAAAPPQSTVQPTPLPKVTVPKIPLTPTVTPKLTPTTPKAGTTPSTTTTPTSPGATGKGSEKAPPASSEPEPITLDTNAASTYNPYGYPASNFGDASLAIDEDPKTAWTALVNASSAPDTADGVLIDLKAQQKVKTLRLITTTPGMTVQVYGTADETAPSSITDPQWVSLDSPHVAKKSHFKLKLRYASRSFYYVMLWISKAPSSSTAAAPGHVSVNEIELIPPG